MARIQGSREEVGVIPLIFILKNSLPPLFFSCNSGLSEWRSYFPRNTFFREYRH